MLKTVIPPENVADDSDAQAMRTRVEQLGLYAVCVFVCVLVCVCFFVCVLCVCVCVSLLAMPTLALSPASALTTATCAHPCASFFLRECRNAPKRVR